MNRIKSVFKNLYISNIRFIYYPITLYKLSVIKKQKNKPIKLHVGCGKVKLNGWINIDIIPGAADVLLDWRKLPFKDNSVDLIYSEHFIEHLEYSDAEKFIYESYRCLKPGGVLRIATPDLDYLVRKYLSDWKNQEWLKSSDYEFIKTRGQMINIAFRWWGHKYVFNEEDLLSIFRKVGFNKIKRCNLGESDHPELRNLERRMDSTLIMEGWK